MDERTWQVAIGVLILVGSVFWFESSDAERRAADRRHYAEWCRETGGVPLVTAHRLEWRCWRGGEGDG
jgi:hypothetical protein